MSDQNGSHKFRQDDELQFYRKILWLFAALSPSGIAIGFFKPEGSEFFLFGLCVVLCVAASVGLVRGMRNKVWQRLFCVLLAFFFFALNTLIVVFAGCSSMGRIAP